MSALQISKTRDRFEKDGKPFFYLADTLWTLFSNLPEDQWQEYLEYRGTQGFNAYQACLLHQWDGGKSDLDIYPFAVDSNLKFDFSKRNDAYFLRARKMVETAYRKGFVPALVLLWGYYVPDTWMSKKDPRNIMPLDALKSYVKYVVKLFAEFSPIYLISGDTNFGSPESCKYYRTVYEIVKKISPDSLTTLHLNPETDWTEEFLQAKELDFYMVQSGHGIEHQHFAYTLAERFYGKAVKRPVVNGEPCYEGHGFGGKYGRHNEFNVRKALWQSLLSGAKAGFTYGAHGIWNFYKDNKQFINESFGGRPMLYQAALHFNGAWDAGYAKWIFETNGFFDLEPAQDRVLNETKEIRMSISKNSKTVAIYEPYFGDILVKMDLTPYQWTVINLADKRVGKPLVNLRNDGVSVIRHSFNADVLLIGKKD